MRIHDKFVIELKEVIKGYGNDPTVQDPCKFPCDYKFYEIDGVAICEDSFKKMKPLETEIDKVLENIKTEVKELADANTIDVLVEVIRIINKHKGEEE